MPLPAFRSSWRRIARWTGIVAAVCLGLALAGLGGGWLWLDSGVAPTSGTVRLPGLDHPVRIVRDRNDVPYITAADDHDAYFALGYVHAQDRLWQMEMQRRVGAGRLSELVGPRALGLDRFMRTLGLYRAAESDVATLAPATRAALQSYADGVNAWIAHHPGPLPPEFLLLHDRPEPWRPADSLVWAKLMALQLSSDFRTALLRARMLRHLPAPVLSVLYPPYPTSAPVTLAAGLGDAHFDRLARDLPPPLGPRLASNEWVVAGSRTATGKPILANDPHLGLSAPILWYLAEIDAPGLHVAGATVPGVPFHLLGHNRHIAWGITTTGSAVEDLFVERIDGSDPTRYLAPGGPRRFRDRTETIHVRGGLDDPLVVRETRHGPVISDVVPDAGTSPGEVVALALPALLPGDTTADAFYRLNRAHDWTAFRQALSAYRTPQQNFVYADTGGTIGFIAPGLVPIRKQGDGSLPVPGWTGAYDWSGFIPFDALPRTVDPPSGQIVNANNAVVGPNYPFPLTWRWESPFRAHRIATLLDRPGPQTLDTTHAIQLDIHSTVAQTLLPAMLAQLPADLPARSRQVVAMLRAWNLEMDRKRPEPLIFSAWLDQVGRNLFQPRLRDIYGDFGPYHPEAVARILAGDGGWCGDAGTAQGNALSSGQGKGCGPLLARALGESLDDLAHLYGPDPTRWRWSAVHRAPLENRIFSHIPVIDRLTDIGIATDGGNETVARAASTGSDPAHPFYDDHGPGFRAIYDLSDLARSRFVIATGQSGTPLSRHYGDFVRRWRDGATVTLDPVTAAADGIGTTTLLPAARR